MLNIDSKIFYEILDEEFRKASFELGLEFKDLDEAWFKMTRYEETQEAIKITESYLGISLSTLEKVELRRNVEITMAYKGGEFTLGAQPSNEASLNFRLDNYGADLRNFAQRKWLEKINRDIIKQRGYNPLKAHFEMVSQKIHTPGLKS